MYLRQMILSFFVEENKVDNSYTAYKTKWSY